MKAVQKTIYWAVMVVLWALILAVFIFDVYYLNQTFNNRLEEVPEIVIPESTLMIEPVEIVCKVEDGCNPNMTPEPIDLNNRNLRLEE